MEKDLLNKYYTTESRYAFIEIKKEALIFHLSNPNKVEESIVDIRNNFGISMFDNIELSVSSYDPPIVIEIKKNGVLIESYGETLDDGIKSKNSSQDIIISINDAKRMFENIGNETVVLNQDKIMIPIVYNGLVIELSEDWKESIGKLHPDLISARLMNEAMTQFADRLDPKIKS